jgi:hypothetical protein
MGSQARLMLLLLSCAVVCFPDTCASEVVVSHNQQRLL